MSLCLHMVAAACGVSIGMLHECKMKIWAWFKFKGVGGGWRPAGH